MNTYISITKFAKNKHLSFIFFSLVHSDIVIDVFFLGLVQG